MKTKKKMRKERKEKEMMKRVMMKVNYKQLEQIEDEEWKSMSRWCRREESAWSAIHSNRLKKSRRKKKRRQECTKERKNTVLERREEREGEKKNEKPNDDDLDNREGLRNHQRSSFSCVFTIKTMCSSSNVGAMEVLSSARESRRIVPLTCSPSPASPSAGLFAQCPNTMLNTSRNRGAPKDG